MKKIWNSKLWLPVLLVFLFGVNWLAASYHTRIDLTNEKRFTLSAPTKKILHNLSTDIDVKVFLKGASNSGFTKLSKSAEELLQEFKEIAGTHFSFSFVDPDDVVDGTPSTTYADTLQAIGMTPLVINAQIKNGEQQLKIYPVALISGNQKNILINLYEGNSINLTAAEINSAEAMLEYNSSKGVSDVTRDNKPMIAYSVGNGEATGPESYDIRNTLQSEDTLFTLDLNKVKLIPDTFSLLLIVKPKIAFNDEEKLKIDQYVMRGGKLLLFMDKLDAEMDSLKIKNEVIAYDRGLQLEDLLFKYGVRVNSDLVMDLICDKLPFDVNGNGQYEMLKWNYFPLFQSISNHLINKNLGIISSQFANSIDTVEAEGIRKTVLLQTSANSRTIGTPALISGAENRQATQDDKFNRSGIPVAYLLEGKFSSLYRNRLSQAAIDTFKQYGITYYPENLSDNKMIIVADGDIVLNSFYKQEPLPMGVNPYSMVKGEQSFPISNRGFLMNCVDYLVDDQGLIEAKSKDYTLRFLDPKKIETQRQFWQLFNIAVPIFLVFLFALIFQWIRKGKYK